MTEELYGTYAQVHPRLLEDPAERQGQIGMFTYAEAGKDDFYLSFPDGKQGRYSSNELLVLRKGNDTYRDVVSRVAELTTPEFRTLLQVSLKQQSIYPLDHKAALELATTNETTAKFSLIALSDKLGIQQSQQIEQDDEHQGHRRGR
ncbi:hypothetical protein [Mucilaginibacter paludis]|uniref:Uncharacterized protein n=1 Tax=Mucilaginibacter paludis DSM 18603 TaxID=714943 RepID=H1YI44_9SPHI|nr:hypothetical protein [Mucilaginibacter paludis]EHQ26479.1 hypothetical protein Mucpa_2349 [Mucilaginibacter paludis DSM 18603]